MILSLLELKAGFRRAIAIAPLPTRGGRLVCERPVLGGETALGKPGGQGLSERIRCGLRRDRGIVASPGRSRGCPSKKERESDPKPLTRWRIQREFAQGFAGEVQFFPRDERGDIGEEGFPVERAQFARDGLFPV